MPGLADAHGNDEADAFRDTRAIDLGYFFINFAPGTGIKDFGCFAEFLPGQEGLVHISELADFRVNRTDDVVKMGEEIWVKVLSVEDNGKVRLSRKAAMAEKGETSREG